MASWQWFHRLGSPRWFYEKTERWLFWLALSSLTLLTVGTVWGLMFVPPDYKQGNSFRILYIHAPTSMMAMSGYYVMAIAGAIGLIWRMKLAFMVMKSAAPIGAVLTALSLATGWLWGKPTWGALFVWDARVVFTAILLMIYVATIALQGAYRDQDTADKATAILSIVGMVNIPLIYKSVDWWNTLHQPATIKFTEKSPIDPSMLYPFLLMILAFYVTYAWILIAHTRMEILQREKKTKWVKELIEES